MESVAKGLFKAWELYGCKTAVVVMVVQPNEGNIFDQRWIEYELGQRCFSFPFMIKYLRYSKICNLDIMLL
jgi:glutathione synthase